MVKVGGSQRNHSF